MGAFPLKPFIPKAILLYPPLPFPPLPSPQARKLTVSNLVFLFLEICQLFLQWTLSINSKCCMLLLESRLMTMSLRGGGDILSL